ncbi:MULTISPECIES: hypothetical protein [Streptomyces]|uniref:Uncharacterized protein n=1 Tax=Streptomyces stelliscabiei TaxID=146820 RepID=A0A8I0PET5_9ACTN|nr:MULTISPECIES: hypothetical protein [Streptomyces]MBE1602822.1 hypothetical protein [Streptomyces stelliscabiei]MDX2521855.1 hypothetical protein [Streptomyces stelliscabiei]SOD65544.1 hypothetical protein SAMN06272781_0209 [Streptomyces sp. 1222.2]
MTATRPVALVTGASPGISVLHRIVATRTFDRSGRKLSRMPG